MEAIRTERGRVAAGKHRTRPAEIHRRGESRAMLADGWPHGPKEWLLTALMVLTMTGILPMAAASFLMWLLAPVPPGVLLACFCALLLGAAAWLWRAL